jgi:hypothetical protein
MVLFKAKVNIQQRRRRKRRRIDQKKKRIHLYEHVYVV